MPDASEIALVLRHGLDVEVLQLSAAAGAFVYELQAGAGLGKAAEEATTIDTDFNLISILGLLFQKSAITALNPTRSTT